MRHAKARFFFQGALFLKEPNSYLFPNLKISHSQKAACWNLCDRLLTSGRFSEEAWFPEKLNFSVLHSDQISDRRKPVYGGTQTAFPTASAYLANRMYVLYVLLSSNIARNLPMGTSKKSTASRLSKFFYIPRNRISVSPPLRPPPHYNLIFRALRGENSYFRQ